MRTLFLAALLSVACLEASAYAKTNGTETMKITSVTVGVPVTQFEKAIDWYKAVLGPRETIQPVPSIFEFDLGSGTWLQLIQSDSIAAGDTVVRLGVENIDAEHARLKKLGIEVTEIERIEGVIAFCRFKDPSGNNLSLYQVLQ